MFIEPRKPVTVDELIRGMVVQSGNDACIALAEAVGAFGRHLGGALGVGFQLLAEIGRALLQRLHLPPLQHHPLQRQAAEQ